MTSATRKTGTSTTTRIPRLNRLTSETSLAINSSIDSHDKLTRVIGDRPSSLVSLVSLFIIVSLAMLVILFGLVSSDKMAKSAKW